ncbi:MAG: SDR family NAD(P)-dependent oxidoreductase [Bacteroidetes bacterium]|nr:MAG: SDR family NAD(P)-dependent oxidoreductase [Bacteroidota bacterium]
MNKKTIIITGSTDGIGKLAAIKLANEGHEIFLHGRNANKLKAVVEEIRMLTKNEHTNGLEADFSDLDAVREMAQEILQKVSKIDVLINNAGVYNSPVAKNQDGLDMRYVVNYLAPFVLTNELLPLLKKGIDPRIINLSSAAQSSVSLDVLSGIVKLPESETYAQSKLALTMWSFHLAKSLEGISVIAVNPGSLLNTNMVKEAFGRFWSSADKGGDILYELAIAEKYKGVTGKYYDNDKGSFGQAHPDAYNDVGVEKLVIATTSLLGN